MVTDALCGSIPITPLMALHLQSRATAFDEDRRRCYEQADPSRATAGHGAGSRKESDPPGTSPRLVAALRGAPEAVPFPASSRGERPRGLTSLGIGSVTAPALPTPAK